MASLQIRDMPDELYEALKSSAEKDHRSLAQQALVLLETMLRSKCSGKDRRRKILEDIRSQKIQIKSRDLDVSQLIREDRKK